MRKKWWLGWMCLAAVGLPAQSGVQDTPTPRVTSRDAIMRAAAARLEAPQLPLSPIARLGQKMFFDPRLSGSGKISCSTCHDPAHAYAPGNNLAAQLGGPHLSLQGARAVPSLTYRERTPRFKVGLDTSFDPDSRRLPKAARPALASASSFSASATADPRAVFAAQQVVPEGGVDWDGRAAVLAEQAGGPLMDPREMANKDGEELLAKLKSAPYAHDLVTLFGADVFSTPETGLGDVYLALARYQLEDRSFHAYNSKYDYYLAGLVQLSAQEQHGLKLFDDPQKGNCAACHLDKPTKNRLAPAFTDYEFEALGVPRNRNLAVNRNPAYFDEGLCGPFRKDAVKQDFCGLFKTPSLRNVATRKVFFHNGAVHSLEDAVRFYVERDTRPEKWYPRGADGSVVKYDDLPPAHRVNVDVKDAPLNRHRGDPPALHEQEIRDVVAFLRTLTDGYQPPPAALRSGPPSARELSAAR